MYIYRYVVSNTQEKERIEHSSRPTGLKERRRENHKRVCTLDGGCFRDQRDGPRRVPTHLYT